MSASPNGQGPLRQVLERAQAGLALHDCPSLSLSELTVLAVCNDPYRLDTPVGHRNGQWFGEVDRFVPYGTVHLRGLHYRLVAAADVTRPG
jgi:hypothetical protein